MTLLEECKECLGEKCLVIEGDKKKLIIERFYSKVKFTKWGRIDWEKVGRYSVCNLEDLHDCKDNYYIIWDEVTLPILYVNICDIIENLDDVTAVSFDTWLVSENLDVIIEIFHTGDIRKITYKV